MFSEKSRAITAELRHAEAELSNVRENLVLSIHGFEGELTRILGWRAWVRRKPLLFLGTAFALGIILGRRR